MIRPQKKRQKDEQKLRDNVQVGDEILTIGGFYCRVVSIKDDAFVVESVADHSKSKIARWAISKNLTVHEDAPETKPAKAEKASKTEKEEKKD